MIIGTLLRMGGYLLDLGLYLLIGLLALEWLVHYLPGAGLNPLRRVLFQATLPFQKFTDGMFPFGFRGLWAALVLWARAKGLVPWVIWAGFVLKG